MLLAAPSEAHELAVSYLVGEFYSYVKKPRGCRVYASNMGVKREKDNRNYLLPDMHIKCSSGAEKETPDLVVEVTSPSSEKNDLIGKTERYQALGVREYWIVLLQQKKWSSTISSTMRRSPSIPSTIRSPSRSIAATCRSI